MKKLTQKEKEYATMSVTALAQGIETICANADNCDECPLGVATNGICTLHKIDIDILAQIVDIHYLSEKERETARMREQR